MRAFAFWYVVFLFGGALGATAGLSLGGGLALIPGLLGGMAFVGWLAQELLWKRWSSSPNSTELIIHPAFKAPQALEQGLGRVRSASASPIIQEMGTSPIPASFGSFSLPNGMYNYAMRKQFEKRITLQQTRHNESAQKLLLIWEKIEAAIREVERAAARKIIPAVSGLTERGKQESLVEPQQHGQLPVGRDRITSASKKSGA
jgi:hypothetical protein